MCRMWDNVEKSCSKLSRGQNRTEIWIDHVRLNNSVQFNSIHFFLLFMQSHNDNNKLIEKYRKREREKWREGGLVASAQ